MVRTALYQAAHVLMHRGRWSGLRGRAMRIAKRSGVKLAKVAPARKLAVVLHRMWSDGNRLPLDSQGSDPAFRRCKEGETHKPSICIRLFGGERVP